jgi:hypothetical protein
VDFTLRDFALFLAIMLPFWVGVEFAVRRPVMIGGLASVFLWLNMFNLLHGRYHEPKGSWFERTWYFRFLKENHRGHHANSSKNLNVSFLPLADWTLGTWKRERN